MSNLSVVSFREDHEFFQDCTLKKLVRKTQSDFVYWMLFAASNNILQERTLEQEQAYKQAKVE